MSEHIISPDGKWMWTGAEWIPTPPGAEVKVNLQDSVMSGDVNIQQSSPNASSVVNLKVCCNLNCRVLFCKECGLKNVDNEFILYAPNFRGGEISDFLERTHIFFGELLGEYNGNAEITSSTIYTGWKVDTQGTLIKPRLNLT